LIHVGHDFRAGLLEFLVKLGELTGLDPLRLASIKLMKASISERICEDQVLPGTNRKKAR
jgi:hypothetical protein